MTENGSDEPDSPHHDDTPATERTTAPQSPYTTRDVGIGLAVFLIGSALVFGLPFVLTF